MLCVGMGTEIFMFILTAFDRPPKEVDWEEVLPTLGSKNETQTTQQVVFAGGNGASANYPSSSIEIEGLDRFSESSERFVSSFETVSEQMTELNRHLSAINSIYELQLRDISSQLQNMDKVSRQIEVMSENMRQLNEVYERMLRAMNPSTQRI